jgi:hypothetical protein
MSADETRTREALITDGLRQHANRVETTVTRYQGVIELRRRQVDMAAAISAQRDDDTNLRDTLTGYAAELERFTNDVRRDVIAFEEICKELHAWYLEQRAARQPHDRVAAGELDRHIENLKVARGASELAIRAKADANDQDHHLRARARAVFEHVRVLDRYITAIQMVEEISMESLSRLGANATTTIAGPRPKADGADGD